MKQLVYKKNICSWMNEIKENEEWFVEPKYFLSKKENPVSVGIMTHFGYYFSSVALGSLAIYHSINRDINCQGIADRIFIYDPIANEDGFTSFNIELDDTLITFERNIPINQLDLLCVSLTDSDAISEIFHLLELSKIPIRRIDRERKKYPLILAGGPGCQNPEAFSDFFDMITIGDGCILTPAIVNTMHSLMADGLIVTVKDIYQNIENKDGLYIPSLYDFKFDGIKIKSIDFDPIASKVKPAIDPPLEWTYGSLFSSNNTAVILPNRGCKNNCSYCQLGLQEYREMPVEPLLKLVDMYLEQGISDIIVNSASVTQYSKVQYFLSRIADKIEKCGRKINIYIGSLCFNELNKEILNNLNRLGAFSHTYVLYTNGEPEKYIALAPEHGSGDLLHSLGRVLKPWEILKAIDMAGDVGVYNFNLYFMVGFPSETVDDREQTAALVSAIADKINEHNGKIIVKINPLIPTPGTACQRMKMISVNQYRDYMLEIKEGIEKRIGKDRYKKQIEMVPLPEERLIVEALIDRADRRIGPFIEKVYNYRISGKKLDTLVLEEWINEIGFTWENLTEKRQIGEILPWNAINYGSDKHEKWVSNMITERNSTTIG